VMYHRQIELDTAPYVHSILSPWRKKTIRWISLTPVPGWNKPDVTRHVF
jgi:hypothetical protein